MRIHQPPTMTRLFWTLLASLALAGCSSCDGASDVPPPSDNTTNLNSSKVDPNSNTRISRSVSNVPVVHLSDAGH